MDLVNRAGRDSVALETTLLAHGLGAHPARELAAELAAIIRDEGARPAIVGVLAGRAIVGMNDDELAALLDAKHVAKANTANLGVLAHRRAHAATTVSATMELAADAAVRVFATGGIGGVHRDYGERWDVSADLAALARFPVAVIASGVKSLLDVHATREALETLGVPVIGFGTDRFPAFYVRESEAGVDARFDDARELARYIDFELARGGRGILIANPIPADAALDPVQWEQWLALARARADAANIRGRDITPALLRFVHELSHGATLAANLALVRANAQLAARIAAR